MLSYILQVIAFQLLFLLVYEALLKKETFFTWNRWYLLLTAVVSLLLPFVQIEALAAVIPSGSAGSSVVWLPETVIGAGPENITATSAINEDGQGFSVNWWLVVYVVGVVGSFFIFLKKYNSLSRLFRFRTIASEKDFRIIEIPDSTIACTFYRTVFLGDKLSEAEKQQMLSHELVHVKQKHSLDLLFFETYKIIFWFNPLIYIYQARIATLHEFIADAVVVKETGKQSYYEQLLNAAFNSSNITFINQFFNHSLIKKRIIMLQRSRSHSNAKYKYLLLLPVMLLMLTAVAYAGTGEKAPQEIMNVAGENPGDRITAEPGFQEDAIPFAVVDEVPVYPGCNQEDEDSRKECLVDRIKDHVNRNFNTGAVKSYMAPGMNRIVVQFKIDRNGKVSNVRSRMVTPGPDREAKEFMEEEANRVVASLPEMQPAKHEGKVVGVMYSLPIQLFAPEEEE